LGVKLGDKLGVRLGENEIKIIELMKDNKYITAKELSEHIKISTTAVDNNISKLKKKRNIKKNRPRQKAVIGRLLRNKRKNIDEKPKAILKAP